jgi:hypothetical protein
VKIADETLLIFFCPRSKTNRRFGFGRGKRTFEHAGICRNPEESPQRKASEANEIGAREHGLERGSACVVLLHSRVIGVEQQVRIDEDHR